MSLLSPSLERLWRVSGEDLVEGWDNVNLNPLGTSFLLDPTQNFGGHRTRTDNDVAHLLLTDESGQLLRSSQDVVTSNHPVLLARVVVYEAHQLLVRVAADFQGNAQP